MTHAPVKASIDRQRKVLEGPEDKAARTRELSYSQTKTTVNSNSTDSGTLYTNGTSNPRYLFHILTSVQGNVGYGPVHITLDIKDGSGTIQSTVSGDVVEGKFNFRGYRLSPGWSIDYTVRNADGTGHDVYLNPAFTGGQTFRTDDTSDPTEQEDDASVTVVEDWESASPLNDWTVSTGGGALTVGSSSAVYESSNALHHDGSVITALTEDNTTVQKGDTFSHRVWGSATPSSSTNMRAKLLFGHQSTGNTYTLRAQFDSVEYLMLEKFESGSRTLTKSTDYVGYTAGEFHEIEVEWGDTITGRAYDKNGSLLASVSMTDSTYQSGSVGLRFNVDSSETMVSDYLIKK